MALEIGSLDITYGSDGGPLYNDLPRAGVLGDSSLRHASETQDGSRATSGTGSSAAEPSVAGLRDRLLREARQERIRCLQVARASERWRASDDGDSAGARATTRDAETQTDPVTMTATGNSTGSRLADASTADCWGQNDEEAQMEAIRTIHLLSQKRTDTSAIDRRIAELEETLSRERACRRDLEALVNQEKQSREALQQQVLCLEAEMDVKENALQASQKALERRDPYEDRMANTLAIQNTQGALGAHTVPSLPQVSMGSAFNLADSRRGIGGRSLSPQGRMGAEAVRSDVRDPGISQLLRELRQPGSTRDPSPMPASLGDFEQGSASFRNFSPMARGLQTSPHLNFGARR